MRLAPYLELLRRNPAFARLYAAQLVSFAGDWFATVALLGLALELTGSDAAASFVLVLQVGPFFVASPIAGVLADRLDRRRLVGPPARAPPASPPVFPLPRPPSTVWTPLVPTASIAPQAERRRTMLAVGAALG